MRKRLFNNQPHPDIFKSYLALGECYANFEKIEKSMKYYKLSY